MRSAELAGRAVAVAALLAGIAGCASVTEPIQSMLPSSGGATTTAAGSAPRPASAASAPAAAASAVVTSAPADVAVSPESQRAFDDAARALRAGQAADAERRFRSLAQAHPELPGPQANIGLIQRQAG